MTKFNLSTAILAAEAGDSALWEDIARHLMAANKPKAKRTSKAFGPQTWAVTTLEDGRRFLTSAYGRSTEALTLAAHSDYAQFRARMEDSGDNGHNRVFLNPAVPTVPVAGVRLVTGDEIDLQRDICCDQRIARLWPNPLSIAAE